VCLTTIVKLKVFMARVTFLVFAAMFCLVACLPLRSKSSESWADVTLALACEDYGTGIVYDRQFDFPTGAGFFIDVPVWAVDAGLFAAAAVAFRYYAKWKLQERRV
jgi:hypothetical protein